jgi:hypothetical protein
VRKEIYPIAAWNGTQPNCVKMEEALDLCGNRTDTERWVGCVCVCVCTGMRVRKWKCFECVWKKDISTIYVNKKEKINCVRACVYVHARAHVKRRCCDCLLERF